MTGIGGVMPPLAVGYYMDRERLTLSRILRFRRITSFRANADEIAPEPVVPDAIVFAGFEAILV